VQDAAPGDMLWFHYSGHGGQLKALISGVELDGLSETIVPVDYAVNGQILDEELKKILVDPIRGSGAALRVVLDCCHSGTGLNLRHNLVDSTALRAIDIRPARDIPAGEPRRFESDGPEMFVEWGDDGERRSILCDAFAERSVPQRYGPVEVCLISGCGDPQTSADATFDRRPGGALTHNLLEYLRTCYHVSRGGIFAAWPTAIDILRNVRRKIREGGFDQVPQFSSEEPISMRMRFNLT